MEEGEQEDHQAVVAEVVAGEEHQRPPQNGEEKGVEVEQEEQLPLQNAGEEGEQRCPLDLEEEVEVEVRWK